MSENSLMNKNEVYKLPRDVKSAIEQLAEEYDWELDFMLAVEVAHLFMSEEQYRAFRAARDYLHTLI